MPAPQKPHREVRGFRTEYSAITNVLKTDVSISEAFDPAKGEPFPEAKPFKAIWDTGATNSAVTSKVVSDCALKPIGLAIVQTASGEQRSNVYLVNILLPNKVAMVFVRVTEATITGDADVLIGMDIIQNGDLTLTNANNKTVFSFQIPSIGGIDPAMHEAAPYKTSHIKVGRNDPCPCGSGKKYKKCCAANK